ncbi:MAG: hypothetical protein WB784_04150 [Rhodanobacteraceae bacterium]
MNATRSNVSEAMIARHVLDVVHGDRIGESASATTKHQQDRSS